jgi:hypothetical protein
MQLTLKYRFRKKNQCTSPLKELCIRKRIFTPEYVLKLLPKRTFGLLKKLQNEI